MQFPLIPNELVQEKADALLEALQTQSGGEFFGCFFIIMHQGGPFNTANTIIVSKFENKGYLNDANFNRILNDFKRWFEDKQKEQL